MYWRPACSAYNVVGRVGALFYIHVLLAGGAAGCSLGFSREGFLGGLLCLAVLFIMPPSLNRPETQRPLGQTTVLRSAAWRDRHKPPWVTVVERSASYNSTHHIRLNLFRRSRFAPMGAAARPRALPAMAAYNLGGIQPRAPLYRQKLVIGGPLGWVGSLSFRSGCSACWRCADTWKEPRQHDLGTVSTRSQLRLLGAPLHLSLALTGRRGI